MKTVLITGITGFAGTNLVAYLAGKDVRLIGHSRNIDSATRQFSNFPVSFVAEVTPEVMTREGVDVVIHLAGIAHDLSNQYQDEDYYRVNDYATRSVYDSFLNSSASVFIFLSSIKAVADSASAPIAEDAAPAPTTAYGASKQKAEQYIQEISAGTTKRYYILRPCMIHGPGNKGNLNLLYRYVKSRLPFPLGAFKNQRSFLSVRNFCFIIERLLRGEAPSGIYHLADSGYLSTTALVRLIGKALGIRVPVLNIAVPLVTLLFAAIGRRRMLSKLTEDMMVSNEKIMRAIGQPLPLTVEDGIIETIRSFDGKKS